MILVLFFLFPAILIGLMGLAAGAGIIVGKLLGYLFMGLCGVGVLACIAAFLKGLLRL
jgi:hypothetical protein